MHCVLPERSRRSKKSTPPRSRLLSIHPFRTTRAPMCSLRRSPAIIVRLLYPIVLQRYEYRNNPECDGIFLHCDWFAMTRDKSLVPMGSFHAFLQENDSRYY